MSSLGFGPPPQGHGMYPALSTVTPRQSGVLPPGIYDATIKNISQYQYFPRTQQRLALENIIREVSKYIWGEDPNAEIFINGSFATTKPEPGDVDMYVRSNAPIWNNNYDTFRDWIANTSDDLEKAIADGQIDPWINHQQPELDDIFVDYFQKSRAGEIKGIIRLIQQLSY